MKFPYKIKVSLLEINKEDKYWRLKKGAYISYHNTFIKLLKRILK